MLELLAPGVRIVGGDAVVAVVVVVLHFLAGRFIDHHSFLERLLVALAADRGREDGDLHADGAVLAQEVDLVQQAVEIAAAGQGLAVVMHHHRHRADAHLVEELEERFGLLRTLALLDHFARRVLDMPNQMAPQETPSRCRGSRSWFL